MTSPLTVVLEDVVTLLNDNVDGFSVTGWSAVETFTPQDLTDLEAIEESGLQILVSPGDMATQRDAKSSFHDLPEVAVQIIDRLEAGSETDEAKTLLDFAKELQDFLMSNNIATSGFKAVSASFSPTYGPNLIRESNVFASIITVVYRKDYSL